MNSPIIRKKKRMLSAAVSLAGVFALAGSAYAQDAFQPSHLQPAPIDAVSQGTLSLTGNISPAPVGAAWRLRGESLWRNPGTAATSLMPGEHWIEFRPITGYTAPLTREVTLAGTSGTFSAAYVTRSSSTGSGRVRATVTTANPSDESLPGSNYRWRLNGESDWRENGFAATDLFPADRSIEFRSFAGFVTPVSREIGIIANLGLSAQATYHRVPATPWTFTPLANHLVGTAPYQFIGKVTSSHGSFTGTAIAQYTVLTTLEAVYDIETKSFLPGVVWQPAAQSGYRTPAAMSPAGYILLKSYTESTLANPENSLVAIYFRAPICYGGWSGFHVDSDPINPDVVSWLIEDRESLSVGYPAGSNSGKLHTTSARPLPQTFSGTTFSLNDFPSVDGMRGAPLLLKKSNGTYFPAAVFVGGTDDRTFRIVDASVRDAILTAEDAAIRGKGGTFSEGNRLGTIFLPTDPGKGKVRTIISDSAGTTWNIAGQNSLTNGSTVEVPAVDTPVSFENNVIAARNVTVVEGITIEILVSIGQGYPVWAQGIFTPADNTAGKTGSLEDFDGDGVPNLLEWAFGLDAKTPDARPSSGTVSGLPVVETVSQGAGRKLTIHYIRRKSAVTSNILSYKAQFTGDFNGWDDQTAESCMDLNGGEFECVTVEDPGPAGTTRRFARVAVTEMNAP